MGEIFEPAIRQPSQFIDYLTGRAGDQLGGVLTARLATYEQRTFERNILHIRGTTTGTGAAIVNFGFNGVTQGIGTYRINNVIVLNEATAARNWIVTVYRNLQDGTAYNFPIAVQSIPNGRHGLLIGSAGGPTINAGGNNPLWQSGPFMCWRNRERTGGVSHDWFAVQSEANITNGDAVACYVELELLPDAAYWRDASSILSVSP